MPKIPTVSLSTVNVYGLIKFNLQKSHHTSKLNVEKDSNELEI